MFYQCLDASFLLVLATKGDSDIQLRRIEQSGLAQHFHYAYVLPQKAPADYTRIVSEQNLSLDASWSVGNSIRSDINPAIEIGLSAVWIPRTTWDYESGTLMKSMRVFKCEQLGQLPDIVLPRKD